jgi:hypothetical protein
MLLLAQQADDGFSQVDLLGLLQGGPHNREHQHPQMVGYMGINLDNTAGQHKLDSKSQGGYISNK